MGKRHKAWARVARARLLLSLGGICKHCGRPDALEFDCIIPTGDKHHRMDTSARMSFYHSQHQRGNLQILCERCNNIKSAADIFHHREPAATTRAPCPAQGNSIDEPF